LDTLNVKLEIFKNEFESGTAANSKTFSRHFSAK
jgi:hypothetical protein